MVTAMVTTHLAVISGEERQLTSNETLLRRVVDAVLRGERNP